MEKGWCWRAADARSRGLPAPEDPTACLTPRPRCTERAEAVLRFVTLARRQLLAGFGGVYGVNWQVIARLADDAGVETDEDWWALLSAVEGELVYALNPPKAETPPGEGG